MVGQAWVWLVNRLVKLAQADEGPHLVSCELLHAWRDVDKRAGKPQAVNAIRQLAMESRYADGTSVVLLESFRRKSVAVAVPRIATQEWEARKEQVATRYDALKAAVVRLAREVLNAGNV